MKNCIQVRTVSHCGLAAMLLSGTSAFAQSAAPAPAPAPQVADTSQSDIVVTARRREENVQTVPVAITAFSQTTLERKSITNAFDLNKAVPGLNVSADSGTGTLATFSIRGRGNFYGASSGSVETYFADIPTSAPFQIPTLPPQFFDLQSVQVLKGPQGTLFGRNTTGGAVLFVPQAPTDEFGGYARLQVGTYHDIQFEAAVNLPFSDKLMLRVAGFEWHRQGYTRVLGTGDDPANPIPIFDPAYNAPLSPMRIDNQDVTEVRATLLLKPSDRFTNSTIFTYHTDQDRASPQIVAFKGNIGKEIPGTTCSFNAAADPYAPCYPTGPEASPRVLATDVNLRRPPSSTFAVVNTSTYELNDSITIKNILGYINAEGLTNNPADPDGSRLAAVDTESVPRQLRNFQTTDELQLQGHAFDNKLDYIVGGIIDLTRQPGGRNLNITNNSYPQGASGDAFAEQFRQSHYTSKSAFGSLTYHITDKLSATAGARHIWDSVSEHTYQYDAGAGGLPLEQLPVGVTCATGLQCDSAKFQGWAYNGSIEWRPTNQTMLYGGYRHGYKRGGFNQSQTIGGAAAGFGPEDVNDYYGGIKQDLSPLGVRGHVNLEGFWDVYHGAQRSYLGINAASATLTTIIENVPKITYRGFDMDFVAELAPWFELSGNYTFVDAFEGKYIDPTSFGTLVGGDLSVNPVGQVSKNKVSVTGRFHKQLSDGSEIAVAPTLSYQSRFYYNDDAFRLHNIEAGLFGVPGLCQACEGADYAPGYKLVDLRVEWNKIFGSKVDLAFNGNNLLNKTYRTGGGGIYLFGFEAVAFGPPRMFTVEAKVHF